MNERRVIALGFFDGVHIGHGALLKKTCERAAELGAIPAAMSFDTHPDTLVKGVEVPLINSAEERAEMEREAPGSPERAAEFGDLLFALVNVARKEGIDAESALRASTAKFRRRWAAMEQMAADAHVDLAELSTHGLNDLWDAAKAGE